MTEFNNMAIDDFYISEKIENALESNLPTQFPSILLIKHIKIGYLDNAFIKENFFKGNFTVSID